MSEIGICSDCKSMPMIHVGNLIKAELERQGRSKVWFAAAINRSESVCYTRPIPFGNALTKFLKPYIKKAVKELVKKNLINKTTGKKLSKTLIGCTTVSGLCKLAKEQLDAESYIGIAKSSTQWGYETFIMQDEISAQVKSNMKEYLESYKENSQYYDAN